MPINIYRHINEEEREEVAWLCGDDWEIPSQMESLENWLKENSELSHGDYVADIGFSVRDGASGGGGVVTTEMMKMMLQIGIQLYLSEYSLEE